MIMRRDLAEQLNLLTRQIKGSDALDPIDLDRALKDPDYNQCGDSYNIVAGAPANYHTEPCIFEVDAVKKGGPFTDPATGPAPRSLPPCFSGQRFVLAPQALARHMLVGCAELGYPNYSFLLPSEYWLPGLVSSIKRWLGAVRAKYGAYDILVHPNTGCEVRDHAEHKSIAWLGSSYPLSIGVFSCNALGCNQACPGDGVVPSPPANCSHAH
jgi:hypothetical protein